MIWTEEENEIRQVKNLMNPEGKSCMNCHWSNANEGEEITTCGHHIQNFSINSFCGYWTDPNDPKLKAYFDRRKKELKAKIHGIKQSKQLCQFEQDEKYESSTCKHCGGNKWMHDNRKEI